MRAWRRHGVRLSAVLAVATLPAVSCGEGVRQPPMDSAGAPAATSEGVSVAESQRLRLTGVGATLPYPLYARWFNEYAAVAPVRITYRSEGSPQGIAAALNGSADFGASDIPVSDSAMVASGRSVVHIPMAVGAVAITYNVPGATRPLRLSGEVIADLFRGRIAFWDDARLRAINPGVTLPHLAVRPVRRSDGSGTARIFARYLQLVQGADAPWPDGDSVIVRDGNEAVAAEVKATAGAVAYLEVVYARQNRLPAAHVRNRAGQFVSPMPFEIATAAANTLDGLAPFDDEGVSGFRLSLLDAEGRQAYPLAAFTWLLIVPSQLSAAKRTALADFLHWAFLEGAASASSMGYVPLPSATADAVLARVDAALRCNPCATGAASGTVR
jgi:phosphate transport system substrate-binding protein